MKRPLFSSMLFSLLFALIAASAFAQFQTGNIYGKVQAKDGTVLPGVTVTLSGVGATQSFVTDNQGSFRFLNLSPGTYTLKGELAGYGTATRAGLTVSVGRNADVTLNLNPSVSESITVTAEAPLLDVRKAGTGVNVAKVELEKIPSSRDPWTVLQSAPAVQVDRINVGGSQSGQQSVYHAKGAVAADNTWNVDGVNITDMGATGSSPMYFDFDSFEEMQITTGGSDPRVMTPGVQLNMVTKRGTNDLRGSGRYFYTPGSQQADATVPNEAKAYLAAMNAINYVRDYGAEAGGALWKDHLWLWLASSENKISNQAASTPALVGSFDNIILRDKNAKLNAQVTSSNSAVGFYTFGDKVRNARNLNSVRPFEAAWRQTGPTKVYKLEDTQIFGSSLYLTGMWSKVSGGFSLIPNGGADQSASGPNAYADSASTWHNTYLFYITDRPQKQYGIDGSKFFDIGSMNHELKFGFGYRDTPVTSVSGWPGNTQGYWHFDYGTDCASEGLPNVNCGTAVLTRNRVAGYGEKYHSFYAGDTVLMGNLTLQAGLRWDRQKSSNLPSTSPANPIIGNGIDLPCVSFSSLDCTGAGNGRFNLRLPALDFPGDSRQLSWSSVSPRLGVTYALGADKKTLLRAGYNRYVSQMGATVAGASPLGYVSYAYFYGNDINNDKIIQRNELLAAQGGYYFDPNNPTSATSAIRIDYGMKPPHSDEFLAGFERELMTDFSVGLNYTFRKYHNLVARVSEKHQGQGDYYTRADYVLFSKVAGGTFHQVSGPGTFTTPTVPVYQLATGVPSPVYSVITNRPDYSQKFSGLELTATKRLSNKWMLRGNVSYNDWTESCGELAAPDPTPQLGNCPGGQVQERSASSGAFGNVFLSSKWSYNLTGLYQLPWDFNLGASLTGRQGYPAVWRDRITGARGGTKQVILNPIGETRFDNVYELDLRAAKDFRFFNRVGVTLSADLFNAPNKRTVLQRETLLFRNAPTSNATGYNITETQSPRVWRFGAKINF